jgi:phage terminase large subunit-like protein
MQLQEQDERNLSIIQQAVKKKGWKKVFNSMTEEEKLALIYNWEAFAREEQLPEKDKEWSIWLYLAGRGSGKTRSGAEWCRKKIKNGYKRGALVARTAADVRDTLVEGEAGVLSVCPPWERPIYEPAKRRLFWPEQITSYKDGPVKKKKSAIMTTYSGDEPDQLRGPSHDFAWADELAAWKRVEDAWSNLMFGLRLKSSNGEEPQCCVTTTPRPIKLIRELKNEKGTIITTGTSYDNRINLAPAFYKYIIKRYEGTRIGRQEIQGELLEDNPNALFTMDNLNKYRIKEENCPVLMSIAVAIDPAVTSGEDSNDTGIVAAGVDEGGDYYVIADKTCHKKPDAWARQALKLYCTTDADIIVGEVNNGGDLIEAVIRNISKDENAGITIDGSDVPYKCVRASRGKYIRAEPLQTLAEQGRLHMVGVFPELEDQLVLWSPDLNEESPDRLDAMVWAITYLQSQSMPAIR